MILEATRCVHSAPALWQSLGSGPILSALNEAGGRDYLTEREVERLIEAARQNRCGHRDATAILVAYRHGLRASEVVVLRWEAPPGACVCAGPRLGMPACIRYQPGKVGRCASSFAKHQHRPTSSSRNVAHLFPQPDISAWWPGRAWLRNSRFSFIPTCCGTHAGSSSPTTATILAPSKPISGTAQSCPQFAIGFDAQSVQELLERLTFWPA